MAYKVTVVTLFPEVFPGVLGHSVVGRGMKAGVWELEVVNIRDFGLGLRKTVDDTPYGGGAGMVLRPDVVAEAIEFAKRGNLGAKVVYMGPAGTRFVQAKAREFAHETNGLIILCGHYEGVDQRVLESHVDEVVSVGDFVLSGGENAAFCVVDAVVRLLPGVLGAEGSLHEESFDIAGENGPLVEYAHYTKPVEWEGRRVPEVLMGGNHKEIAAWRGKSARERTEKREKVKG